MRLLIFLAFLTVAPSLALAQHPTELLHKCAPSLRPSLDERQSSQQKNRSYTLSVNDLPEFQMWAKNHNIRVVRTYAPASVVIVEVAPSVFWGEILPQNAVQYADLTPTTLREELPVPGHNLFVNRINAAHARWPHLNGAGISISVKEQRFDSSDVDFFGRYLPSPKSAAQLTDHAHIMATVVAGAGNSDPAGRGAAPGAQISSANSLGLLPDDPADYLAQNTSVQNHSYGTEIQPWYGPSAMAYDQSVMLQPNLLHVFSAGNDGVSSSLTGTYANLAGFSNLSGNFKMAKNVLTVGSVDSFGRVPPFSARGPAYDGRAKPDLVAFGPNGSSEAAALTSGSAAVLQQAFLEKNDTLAAAHTLRAVLLNTADDLTPPGPDFASGYGSLNLKNALRTVLNRQVQTGEIAHADTRNFSLQLPAKAHNLRVLLAWDDPPGSAGTPTALLNDLDLSLLAPDGSMHRPWSLNITPHPDSLRQPAHRGRDSLNNAEQVQIDLPIPGLYQIQVSGRRILSENQTFTITFAWDTLQHFEWDSPVRNDPVLVGEETILRWSTHLTATTGRVEWRPIGASDWQLISPAVPLSVGYHRWFIPDTFAAAQVRMVADGQSFLSDTFLITRALRMRVGFNCPDSILLRWNAAGSGANYQLWGLGNRYLEPLLTTADTFKVLQKKDFPQQVFAVSALAAEGVAAGQKSAAPDINTQSAGCYISTFLAELNLDFQVDLRLQLGTTYGVQRVFFEKIKNGKSILIHEQEPEQEQIAYTDLSPVFGANQYVARLALLSGGELRSDTATVYFAGERTWRILANPVPGNGILTLLSRTTDAATLILYDMLGRHIFEQALGGELRTDIALPGLPPGCYLWNVTPKTAEAHQASGVMMIR